MRNCRPLLASALALASLTLTVSPALPAAAATPATPSGVLVASGAVTGATSHAIPGATVKLYAWPSDSVLDSLAIGRTVPRQLLATTTASSSGTYLLRVAPATLASVAVSGDYANLEADSGTSSWFFTRKVAGKSPAASVNLTGARPETCSGWVYRRQLKQAWGRVGQSYVARNATHVTQGFTYGQGQTSTLGVGISQSDKIGSFHASGTNSESASATQGFPTFGPSNVWDNTRFRIARYYDLCGRGGKTVGGPSAPDCNCKSCTHCQRWLVHSNGWAAGSRIVHPKSAPRTPSSFCEPEASGSSFGRDLSTAVTWQFGLDVAAVGFSGEAQTGYDSTAKINFVFHANRSLCGTTAVPTFAKQLVVRR
jgi:hypothetical protein